jgi:hypothetical protein
MLSVPGFWLTWVDEGGPVSSGFPEIRAEFLNPDVEFVH